MKTNQAPNTKRLEIVDQMLQFHSVQLNYGRPAPSAYIPYQRVYDEFRKQHYRAINRLRKLKDLLVKEEDGE